MQILDRAVRSETFELAYHRARDRDLNVRRETPVYRRYLEADELIGLLDAAVSIDQRSSAETLELAKTVRDLRHGEKLPWKQIAARIGRAELDAHDLLFPTRRGTPRSRQNLNRRVLAPAVARAAQIRAARGDSVLPPEITPHTMRRTFVTLSAQLGRSPSWVQGEIGTRT